MKYLIIDDNQSFLKNLCDKLELNSEIVSFENINNVIKNSSECIFLINAELTIESSYKRTDYKGMDILKEIRIKNKKLQPIILCGFSELSMILQNHPEHLIITAQANKYLQFPFSEATLSNALSALKSIESVNKLKELYRAFIRADFDIKEIGHSFANEFGLELMFRAHQGITGRKLSLNIQNHEKLKGLIAKSDFLYSYFKNPELKDTIIQLRREVSAAIQSEKKKILCIDDQGNDGWFAFYKSLLNDDETNYFVSLKPIEGEDIDKAIDETIIKVLESVNKDKPELVLLDLRLFGDKEKHKKIQEISGFKVLQKIKDRFPYIPVIITSATNKSDNLSELLRAKAHGLWSKPRIEQGDIDIYQKYYDLLSIIKNALTFHKYDEEKIPIKSDYLINSINSENHVDNYLNSYDLIVTDTNCWMMGLKYGIEIDDVAILFKNLVLASKVAKQGSFLIIDDIKRELSDHLHKIPTNQNTKDHLVINSIMASYGIMLMNKIITENKIWVYDNHLTNYRIGDKFKFRYEETNSSIVEQCYELGINQPIYSRDYYIITDDYERRSLKQKLNKRRKVHADAAFINILYHLLTLPNDNRKPNILFISEDTDCRDNIYYLLNHKLKFINELDKKTKTKNSIEKVVSGTFTGLVNDNQNFSITLIDPFDFSRKIESMIVPNTP